MIVGVEEPARVEVNVVNTSEAKSKKTKEDLSSCPDCKQKFVATHFVDDLSEGVGHELVPGVLLEQHADLHTPILREHPEFELDLAFLELEALVVVGESKHNNKKN